MNIEDFRNCCLSKEGVTESFPFGEDTLVFKVMGKIFALSSLSSIPARANLKCDPERAEELRELYVGSVVPGYHMNKKHWNTLLLENLPKELLQELIAHSYELVVAKLSGKEKQFLIKGRG